MGLFSYICKGCGTPINAYVTDGEECVLIAVQDGKEVGRVTGYYNGYGCVFELLNPVQELIDKKSYKDDLSKLDLSKVFSIPEQICPEAMAWGELRINSSMAAWHKKCYDEAPKEKQDDLSPSENDEDQGGGIVRPEFQSQLLPEKFISRRAFIG